MNEEKLKKKFKGYFHDPVFKVLIVAERKGHEKIADEIFEILDQEEEKRISEEGDVKTADHIASAADRLLLPKGDYFNISFKSNSEIIHPFSGEKVKVDLKDLIKYDRDEFQNAVIGLLKSISEGKVEKKELFILIWETYEKLLLKTFKAKSVISKLPADTRFPDHSIWEHLSTVSALSSALPEPAFFIFSISPVQSFITTAKKTRDFWLGSYILSYLTWQAIKKVIDEFGPDSIVFPDLHGQPFFYRDLIEPLLDENKYENNDIKKVIKALKNELKSKDISIPSIPNRFLAIVNYNEGKKLMDSVKEAVKNEITNIYEKTKGILKKWSGDSFDDEVEKILERQILNFFKFSSVLVPWSLDKENPDKIKFEEIKNKIKPLFGEEFEKEFFGFLEKIKDLRKYGYNSGTIYSILYEIAERFSAAQKSLRLIEKNLPEKYYKCTLCGEREALHPEGEIKWNALGNFWKGISTNSGGLIDESEKLCGVCFAKRVFGYYLKEKYGIKERFPSTADIATRFFRENIKKAELKNLDGEFFYIDFHKTKKFGEKLEYLERKGKTKEKIEALLNDIKRHLENSKEKPSRYYAIVKFDGDRLGKILKGALNNKFTDSYHSSAIEKLKNDYKEFFNHIDRKELKRPMSPALHRLISRALRNFSIEFVKEAIEKKGLGKVVYSGGDDVFAFLPLENFFSAINLLRALYSGEVEKDENEWKVSYGKGNGWIEKDGESYITLGKFATASLGVSIVHWQEPLSLAIKLADEAEKEAKNSGRNAFSIKFKRRSGEIRSSTFNWYYLIKGNGEIKRYDFIGDFVNFILKLFKEEEVTLENESEKKQIPVIAELSPNFIQTLKLEFSRLWEDKVADDKSDNEIVDLFIEEFLRTFKRSLSIKESGGKDELSKKEKKQLIIYEMRKKLENLKSAIEPAPDFQNRLWKKIDPFSSIKGFLHLIEIIHFIAKGGE